tara:strand:- start:1133 stop:1654 length:522 start_codon:yes stop_codon:yes gene_type:complete
MKFLHFIFSSFFILSILVSCQKEEPLTPNKDLANSQQAGIDSHNQNVEMNNGGSDIGGDQIVEFYSFTVDGVSINSSEPIYQTALAENLTSSSFRFNNLIELTITGEPEPRKYTFFSGNYFRTQLESYLSINGEIVLDSVTTSFIQGTFYFDAININGTDSISISNGSFRVKR